MQRTGIGFTFAVADVLIYAGTMRSPELRHEVPVAVPDPFLYVEQNATKHAVLTSFVADRLRAKGIEVRPDPLFFAKRRRAKNEAELAGIRKAQRGTEAAMDAARDLFRRAEPSNGQLTVDGETLTCELVKGAITDVFNRHGLVADEMIVAHGPQTAVGHD